ncbi:hypothetical protein C8R47DRAFT_445589 [Mycena vitilis]|nr:hypothetical protein C8R47DRAFT_445589 [Mycena vitilis]
MALGAAPKQVYIHGIAQLETRYTFALGSVLLPRTSTKESRTPRRTLEPQTAEPDVVVSRIMRSIFSKDTATWRISVVFTSASASSFVVGKGRAVSALDAFSLVLEGGPISLARVSYGRPLGLAHIIGEASTNDDPQRNEIYEVLDGTLIDAADGLLFICRHCTSWAHLYDPHPRCLVGRNHRWSWISRARTRATQAHPLAEGIGEAGVGMNVQQRPFRSRSISSRARPYVIQRSQRSLCIMSPLAVGKSATRRASGIYALTSYG